MAIDWIAEQLDRAAVRHWRRWMFAGSVLLAGLGVAATLIVFELRARIAMDELRTFEVCGQAFEVAEDYVGLRFGPALGEPVPEGTTRYGIRPVDPEALPPEDLMELFRSVPPTLTSTLESLSYDEWAAEVRSDKSSWLYRPSDSAEVDFGDGCHLHIRLEKETRFGTLYGKWLFAVSEISSA